MSLLKPGKYRVFATQWTPIVGREPGVDALFAKTVPARQSVHISYGIHTNSAWLSCWFCWFFRRPYRRRKSFDS